MISAYTLIRSARRTIAICIQEDGSVIVRAYGNRDICGKKAEMDRSAAEKM